MIKTMVKSPIAHSIGCMALTLSSVPAIYAQENNSLALEEVIVTARKRTESLQDVPLSVTAITRELKQSTIRNLKDISGFAPNVTIEPITGAPGASSISIRGVSYQEIDKTYDPSIGVIVDGVYLGSSVGTFINNFDIERIEVLRGPQGTLFGKNTIGGVINIITSEPTMEWGGKIGVTLGSEGREDYKVIANAPLIKDKLGLKVFGASLNNDGYITNTTIDEDAGGQDFANYGFSLLARPTEDLSLRFNAEHANDKTDLGAYANGNDTSNLVCLAGLGLLPLANPVSWGPEACEDFDSGSGESKVSTNTRNRNESELDALSLEVNWNIGDYTLTSITASRKIDEDHQSEYDGSSAEFFSQKSLQNFDQLSQEFRVNGQVSESFEFVAGLYYFNTDYDVLRSTLHLNDFFAYNLLGVVPIDLDLIGYNSQEQETKSYAAFFSSDWHFTDQLTLTTGIRYTEEEKDFTGYTDIVQPEFLGTPTEFEATKLDDDWGEVSPKVGLSYDYSDEMMFFGSYTEGFKSGGFFGRNQDFENTSSYQPEYVTTFEIGAKTQWLEDRVQFNATAFYSEYDDKQEEVIITPDPSDPSYVLSVVLNASTVIMQGIELEFTAQVTENWIVRSSYGYNDVYYDEFYADLNGDGTATDNSDLTLRNAPENTVSFTTSYVHDIGDVGMAYNLNWRWKDEVESIINNDPRGHQDGIQNLDASIDMSYRKLLVSVFGRNLTDEIAGRAINISTLTTFRQYQQGSNYGVEFTYNF
ncbi:MAG: TonB-dependent receptor [Halioglobus sp.]